MVEIVFSKTIKTFDGKNVSVENGDLATTIKNLKTKDGKDMIEYGGANFVSSLIKEGLIDEYHLIINPTAMGKQEGRFNNCHQSTIAVLMYEPTNFVLNTFFPSRFVEVNFWYCLKSCVCGLSESKILNRRVDL